MTFNWDKHGIDISKVVGGKAFCPKCHHTRKHKRDRSLSVDIQHGLFNCHNCDFRGTAVEYVPEKKYDKPVPRLEKLSKKLIDWFEKERGISNDTLLRFKITEGKEWLQQFEQEAHVVCFNYFRKEQLVNIKFRGPKKSFKMAKDAELIFYNLDSIVNEKECVIVEGEIDCLSVHEAGIYNVISVPNGASKGSQKLEYLDNCWRYFEDMTKIVIATDDDEAGRQLSEELIRRLGRDKCYTVEFPEGCKDANEVLLKHGKQAVKDLIEQAEELPIEGIKTIADMYPTVTDWFLQGYPKGASTGIPGFDDLLTFVPGQLTTVTGIPGHGKDEWMNYVMASLAKKENWCFGILGFEETPEETVTKLIEKLSGKSFAARRDMAKRVSREEYEKWIDFIHLHFYFLNPDEIETDIDSILEKAAQLVKRYGIKVLYLNPWNWMDHNRPNFVTETEYVSMVLSKIIKFAKKHQVHVFLLAHTTKMIKNKNGKYEVPTLYNISGSAHFFNKTHNGITVYRDYATNTVDVYVQKVKQSWLGHIGFSTYQFDKGTRQYNHIGSSMPVVNEEKPLELGPGNWRSIEPEKQTLFED